LSDAGHDIGVAAFPLGHPHSASPEQDIRVLRMKEQAGASFAITQMVFDTGPYLHLIARAGRAGIELPIVPGILPVAGARQVPRLQSLCGAPLPTALLDRLEAVAGDEASETEVGVAWAVDLVSKLLEAGAPGVHFYTLNRADAPLEVCRRLELMGH
jgi:methylenetetrahydrofolate reductase (NADPH)